MNSTACELDQRISQFVPTQVIETDQVSLSIVRRLAATLDVNPSEFGDGDELPTGWHFILFPPLAGTSALGPDGHPQTGGFLPKLGLPRRMFAGRSFEFHKPLRIGQHVRRESIVSKITPKTGRSGILAFVSVENRVFQGDDCAITELQTIVYRGHSDGSGASQKKSGAALESGAKGAYDWRSVVTPDYPMLFRYSAVTFNAHRIHYDLDYAREAEGHPNCLTNGGLTTLLMLRAAQLNGWKQLSRFSVQNHSPLFVNLPITIAGRMTGENDAEMIALTADGNLAVQAEVVFQTKELALAEVAS